jgi:predicted small lipoprotein YifL
MRRLLAFASMGLLAACGQKGPLYQPDEGVPVAPQSSPAAAPAPAPGTSSGGAVTLPPTVPASPDRSDEARKRIPQTPAPAESR